MRVHYTLNHGGTPESKLTESARIMLRQWVSDAHGDKESVARYMAYALRIGGIRACRELINNAVSSTHTTTEQSAR